MQSCNSLPPLPPLPDIRIPGAKGQSHFFSPWIAFWDSGRLPLRLPKPCCLPYKLLVLGSINHSLSVVTVVALEPDIPVKYRELVSFPSACYFCNTAGGVCHLQVKKPWLCCQGDVFLVLMMHYRLLEIFYLRFLPCFCFSWMFFYWSFVSTSKILFIFILYLVEFKQIKKSLTLRGYCLGNSPDKQTLSTALWHMCMSEISTFPETGSLHDMQHLHLRSIKYYKSKSCREHRVLTS